MTRYAIYFVPAPQTPFAAFGAHAIGYDVAAGAEVPFHEDDVFRALGPGGWTGSPARYGFHATLKAPFELAEGVTEKGLEEAISDLARAIAPVQLGMLAVTALGGFIALTPKGDASAVDALAAACVEGFEAFRAPLPPADRDRRLAAGLTDRQAENVERWGYPYVFEEFRFHMTLTGRIDDAPLRKRIHETLAALYAAVDAPHTIDALTICRQLDRDSHFTVLSRHPLLARP
jgi:putative phosphonate metabolism protein